MRNAVPFGLSRLFGKLKKSTLGKMGYKALMTTPLYTGDYMDSGSYAPILLALFPIILTLWANLGSVVSEASKEENEEKL